jgi:hypothetical protein
MLKSKLCELLPVGAILLVRKLGEVASIWGKYDYWSAISVCAHRRTTMGKAAQNRHNEAIRGAVCAEKRAAQNMQAAKSSLENKVEEKSSSTKRRIPAQPPQNTMQRQTWNREEHRVSVMAWACQLGVSQKMLALGHELEIFWREQMQTDKAGTRQRHGREKADKARQAPYV